MRFDADDLDWAMGELANLFAQANQTGILPHLIDPSLFYEAWTVISFQPIEVSKRCHQMLISMLTPPHWSVSKDGGIKRIYSSERAEKPIRYENTVTY